MADLVPAGAWDTHLHVFDPEKFPYAPKRSYTPRPAQLLEYPVRMTGCKKLVVVHASIQGTSTAPLLDTLQKQNDELEGYTLRGLATIDPDTTTDSELDRLHEYGVRGSRLHKMAWGHGRQSTGVDIINDIRALSLKTARLGWAISVFCPLSAWASMAEDVRTLDSRIKLIADHFGGSFPGDEHTWNFEVFLQLVREKRIFVKISGFDRLYHGHVKGMDAMEPIASAIIKASPDQIIFGTDWPHTQLGVAREGKTDVQRLNEVEDHRVVNDATHIRKFRDSIADDATWTKLFVSNAERLFQ